MWLAAAGASYAQTPLPDPAPTLGAVFKEVPRDLWKFVSWDTAIVVGAGGGAALVGHVWDDDLAHEVETSTPFNNAMEAGHAIARHVVDQRLDADRRGRSSADRDNRRLRPAVAVVAPEKTGSTRRRM